MASSTPHPRPRFSTLVILVVAASALALLAGCDAAKQTLETVDRIAVSYIDGPSARYPSIEPESGASAAPDALLTWQFEGSEVTLAIPIDGEVLAGARAANKSASIPVGWEPEQWEPDYYRAFVDDPALEPLYDSMLVGLRDVRDSSNLDSDRYAELILSMAQAIEYHTDGSPPKFAIETIVDGKGDCDDKAILATALLAREGYDVALLGFSAENHMSLGIRSSGSTFRSSGYSFVEMTTDSLVGWYNRDSNIESAAGQKLESEPRVITIGTGAVAYAAGAQTDSLRDTFDGDRALIESLEPEIESARATYGSLGSQMDDMTARMDELKASGDTEGYNALVDDYNQLLSRYNSAVAAYNKLVKRQSAAVERSNRVLAGQSDRSGLAEWLNL